MKTNQISQKNIIFKWFFPARARKLSGRSEKDGGLDFSDVILYVF